MSKKAGRDESFFEATSLHGLKYINKSGTQRYLCTTLHILKSLLPSTKTLSRCCRLLWIVVLILSILATYFFFKGTLEEYFGDNMKVVMFLDNVNYINVKDLLFLIKKIGLD